MPETIIWWSEIIMGGDTKKANSQSAHGLGLNVGAKLSQRVTRGARYCLNVQFALRA